MSDEQKPTDIPTGQSIFEGSAAQVLGGSLCSAIVTGLASLPHPIYFKAGFESALGTFGGLLLYLGFKFLRMKVSK